MGTTIARLTSMRWGLTPRLRPLAILIGSLACMYGCTDSTTTYDIDIMAVVVDPEPDGTPYLVYLYAAGRHACQQNDPDPECLYIDSGTVTVPGEELPLDGVLEDVQDDCLFGIFVGVFRSAELQVYPYPPWTAVCLRAHSPAVISLLRARS